MLLENGRKAISEEEEETAISHLRRRFHKHIMCDRGCASPVTPWTSASSVAAIEAGRPQPRCGGLRAATRQRGAGRVRTTYRMPTNAFFPQTGRGRLQPVEPLWRRGPPGLELLHHGGCLHGAHAGRPHAWSSRRLSAPRQTGGAPEQMMCTKSRAGAVHEAARALGAAVGSSGWAAASTPTPATGSSSRRTTTWSSSRPCR
jgi:hypothetical protein